MSDFSQNPQNEMDNSSVDETVTEEQTINYEESTVFSAPQEHKVTAPKNAGKKRLISVVAAFLAVALLIGGTIAIIKLIPEMKNDESINSVFEDITVIDADSKNFNAVTIKNKNGEFKFVTQQINATDADGNPQTTTYWTVEGIDVSKLSTTMTNSIISAVADIVAAREIDTKTPSECGFDSPKYTISVSQNDGEPYTVLVGNPSPDGLGSYMMVDGKDTIYVAADAEFVDLDFELLDLSDKTSIPITKFPSDTTNNKIADGTYAFFDSLTLSGANFPETLTIVNNKEESASAELLPYLVTTPTTRYANHENLNSLVALFSAESAVAGNYALDVTDETIKLFGLDKPDVVVTMTIDGTPRTFKFKQIDSEYSAVIYDDAPMIRKIITSNHAFLSFKAQDLYFKNLFMNSINDIKKLKFNDAQDDVNFDISYQEKDSKKVYTIIANGKEIVAQNFQDFYADFVGIQCSNFATENVTAQPDGTITFVFYDDSELVVDFYRINDTEYQYAIDGNAMGRITASEYNKMINNIRKIASGEAPV